MERVALLWLTLRKQIALRELKRVSRPFTGLACFAENRSGKAEFR